LAADDGTSLALGSELDPAEFVLMDVAYGNLEASATPPEQRAQAPPHRLSDTDNASTSNSSASSASMPTLYIYTDALVNTHPGDVFDLFMPPSPLLWGVFPALIDGTFCHIQDLNAGPNPRHDDQAIACLRQSVTLIRQRFDHGILPDLAFLVPTRLLEGDYSASDVYDYIRGASYHFGTTYTAIPVLDTRTLRRGTMTQLPPPAAVTGIYQYRRTSDRFNLVREGRNLHAFRHAHYDFMGAPLDTYLDVVNGDHPEPLRRFGLICTEDNNLNARQPQWHQAVEYVPPQHTALLEDFERESQSSDSKSGDDAPDQARSGHGHPPPPRASPSTVRRSCSGSR
jgi:hypothetical protein